MFTMLPTFGGSRTRNVPALSFSIRCDTIFIGMRCFVLISLLTLARFACGGEIVVHEDFEKLDLKKLPDGYSTFTEDLSIAG